MCSAWRFSLSVYLSLSPCGMGEPPFARLGAPRPFTCAAAALSDTAGLFNCVGSHGSGARALVDPQAAAEQCDPQRKPGGGNQRAQQQPAPPLAWRGEI